MIIEEVHGTPLTERITMNGQIKKSTIWAKPSRKKFKKNKKFFRLQLQILGSNITSKKDKKENGKNESHVKDKKKSGETGNNQ